MDGPNIPMKPKGGVPKLLIVVILVVIVAIAGAAVALTQNGGGNNGGNAGGNNDLPGGIDQNDGSGTDGGTSSLVNQVHNGDLLQYTTDTVSAGYSFSGTMKWLFSNVTSTGYDEQVTITSITGTTQYSTHANYSDALGFKNDTVSGDNQAVLIGTETLATPFGDKTVEHWRLTNATDSSNTMSDYYIGKKTPALYKMVMIVTGTSDPSLDMTTTTVLSDTNNDAIKTGNT